MSVMNDNCLKILNIDNRQKILLYRNLTFPSEILICSSLKPMQSHINGIFMPLTLYQAI